MSNTNSFSGKTYIISIAITDYLYFNDLANAIPDAEKIIDALEKDYNVIIYEKLHNIDDSAPIKQTLSKLQREIEPEDSLLILYNGHGAVSKKSNIAYWKLRGSIKNNENSWYKCSDLFDDIKKYNAKGIAVFVNACYSGNLFSQDGIMANYYDKGGKRSRILFTSGIKEEKVEDDNPFASLIVEALTKNKKNFQVPLRRIIGYTITKFKTEDFYSTPRDGYFRQHEGGQFFLYSRNQEKIFWDKANEEASIKGYEQFLEKFPNGEFTKEATLQKDKLVEENDSWLEMLKSILVQVDSFKSRTGLSKQLEQKTIQIHQQIESLRKDISENVDDYEEWSKIRKINNSTTISNLEKIKSLKSFIKQHPNNIYVRDAERYIKRLEEKEEDEKNWREIPKKQGVRNLQHCRRALYEYTNRFYDGKYIDEAIDRYKGVLLFEKAIELFEKGDLESSHELFQRYKSEFPDGEYARNAEQKLKDADIAKIVKVQEKILEKAISNQNFKNIYDVVDFIDGLTNAERKATKEIYDRANSHIAKYEELRQSDYDRAVKNDKIIDFQDFISQYEDDVLAVELVHDMKNKLLDKDTELFNTAEYKTKNVQDFQYYIDELGEEGKSYQKAHDRIAELHYFSSLSEKSGYEDYLNDYPKGLKRDDAAQRIIEIEEEEELSRRFEEALKSDLIEVCQSYLTDFEHKKDERYEAINEKYLQLKEEEQERNLFIEITKSVQYKQFELCTKYSSLFKNKYRFEEVEEIKQEVKAEIDNDAAFENVVFQTTTKGFEEFQEKIGKSETDYKPEAYNLYLIEGFEKFKIEFSSGRNHNKADDYILYFKAKESKKRGDFTVYLEEFEQGINSLKVRDGLLFLDALEQEKIDALTDYLQSSTLLEFKSDAELAIKELEKKNRIETAFQDIQEFNGDIDKAIKMCSSYLLDYADYNKNYDRRVAEKKSQLTYEREEDNDGKDAIEKNNEDVFLRYLNKHKNKGRHYKTITKMLREKQLGVTEKDKDVLNVVQNIAVQMNKSSEDNSQAVTDLVQKFSTQMLLMEKNRKRERRIFYFIIVIIAIIIFTIELNSK